MKNEKTFKETGKKRDRLALLRGLAITTALVLALVFGFAACGGGGGDIDDPLTYSADGMTVVSYREDVTGHVDIPKGVKSIGNGAFQGCTGLPA